jgi:tetratricopeptide (TPR) repeat protein
VLFRSGHLARAQAALALGHPGEARTRLTALTPALPEGDPLAAHTVGLARCGILRALGEPEVGYGEALAWLQRATDGDDPLAVEEALVMVGHCAWASDQNDAATGAFEQAWALRRDRDAAPALQAEALDGLGLCARRDGRPFDAVEAHREALARWEAATGVDSGPASACLHRLAQALHHTGDFLAARETMARALLATAELLGREHVDTWITRFEMARYDVDCGDMEDGFPRMVRARAAVAEQLGAQHPVVRAMDRWL